MESRQHAGWVDRVRGDDPRVAGLEVFDPGITLLVRLDHRLQRVRIAKRFTRLAYAMLAGQQIIPHPCCRDPHYILDKLLAFHLEHEATAAQVRDCLQAAAAQLPGGDRAREADRLTKRADEFEQARKPALQSLGSILREVLAKRLGLTVQSAAEG